LLKSRDRHCPAAGLLDQSDGLVGIRLLVVQIVDRHIGLREQMRLQRHAPSRYHHP